MGHVNIEIKARSENNEHIRNVLQYNKADFVGLDHQIDTYFKAHFGRLKLREGNIENQLIHYDREDKEGPKQSNVTLYKSTPGSSLKEILTKTLGILVVVDKKREIYFIDNVKFHLDNVQNLGTFVEIEAIDKTGEIGKDKLLEQCNYYMNLFNVHQKDLLSVSYSDLLLKK
ncbi:class IV adenylate cyclase [archaeon]|nr:class IV adenylate cyclase [archaeon]